MKVTYRPAIAVDLAEIGAYIARDNPARAATFVTSLVARCEKIGQNPSGGRLRPEIAEEIRSVAFRG